MGILGYAGDVAKLVSGSVDNVASNAGKAAIRKGMQSGMSRANVSTLGHTTAGAVKFGMYGAAGAGIIGGAVGAAQTDKTLVGGTISGAGVGAVAGASIGTVAAAIAKGIR